MSTENTMNLVDLAILAVGIWMLYNASSMRRTGVIPSMLLAKEDLLKVRDSRGFIEHIYKKFMMFAIVMVILGCISLFSDFVYTIPYLTFIEFAIFMIVCFSFYKTYLEARNKYIF